VGVSSAGTIDTDGFSERRFVADARMIAAGAHRFGIVEYTHYPNGPAYALAPAIKLGVRELDSLRIIPIIFSSICFAYCCLSVGMRIDSFWSRSVFLTGALTLLFQPGVSNWMGALNDHSFAFVLCLAGLGLALDRHTRWFVFALLGFVAGWFSYDFIPALICSVFTCQILLCVEDGIDWLLAIRRSLKSSSWVALGTVCAIAAHLVQNALFFGSLKLAYQDLVGSAATRAGFQIGEVLAPDYYASIKSAGMHVADDRFGAMWANFLLFTGTGLVSSWFAILSFGLLIVLIVAVWVLVRRELDISKNRGSGVLISYLLAFAGLAASGCLWFILMPQHAKFHSHFLPRLFFVPLVLMWIVLAKTIDFILEGENPANSRDGGAEAD